MNNLLNFFVILIFYSLINQAKNQDTSLEHVTIFYRHGARSPVRSYPNNPLKESYWDRYGGMFMISANGMKQCYDLGVYIKNYYKNFLAPTYDKSRLYARSTDLDRTLVSSLALLSGLYQPNPELQWNPTVYPNWLPIPVHTVDVASDPLFNYNIQSNSGCDKYNYYRNEFLNSPEYKRIAAQNEAFVREAANYSGLPDFDYHKIWIISDNTINEIIEKIKQSEWVTKNYAKIIEAKDYGFTLDFGSFDRARFWGANLLEEILKNLDGKISGKITYQMAVYANHDSNLSGINGLINITWPLREIPYASAFAFELRKSTTNQSYYVQVLYKDNHHESKTSELKPVKLNKCKNLLCTIEEFRDLVKPSFFKDYRQECAMSGTENISNNFSKITQITYIAFTLLIFQF